MESKIGFLHVQGDKIVNDQGTPFLLRGFCLGGWMNMENFIAGYPGHESGLRSAIRRVLGKEKAGFFFDRFLHYFIQEEDLEFIKELDAVDSSIMNSSSRVIAGFLIQPFVHGILNTTQANAALEEVLSNTRKLYTELAESCQYHAEILKRALERIE